MKGVFYKLYILMLLVYHLVYSCGLIFFDNSKIFNIVCLIILLSTAVLLIMSMIKKERIRNGRLQIASYIFFAVYGAAMVTVLIAEIRYMFMYAIIFISIIASIILWSIGFKAERQE